MLKLVTVISPAKKLDFDSAAPVDSSSEYRFADEAQSLIEQLKKLSVQSIRDLMALSDSLAKLNHERYHAWQPIMTPANSKQALFAFKGDVYVGLAAETLTNEQILHAQGSLRILSGLYGLLRPLDAIQPYRLEMGTRLETSAGKNLYQFWGDKITEILNADVAEQGAELLLNLASNEYFKSVNMRKLNVPVISPVFKDEVNGVYKVVSFYAKKARGLMVRYLLENPPATLDDLKAFDYAGYRYSAQDSDKNAFVFTREEQ